MYGRPADCAWALRSPPAPRGWLRGFRDLPADILVRIDLGRARWRAGDPRGAQVPAGRRPDFCLYAGLQATGMLCTGTLAIGYAQRLLRPASGQVLMMLVLAGAAGYLYLTRQEGGPDVDETGPGGAPERRGLAGGGERRAPLFVEDDRVALPCASGRCPGGAPHGGGCPGSPPAPPAQETPRTLPWVRGVLNVLRHHKVPRVPRVGFEPTLHGV